MVAIVGSGVVLGVRGWRLFRNLKALSRAANAALGSVTAAGTNVEAKAAALSNHTERLTEAAERLQVSLARLAVLRAAAAEVKRSVDGLRGAVPRKSPK